MVTHHAPDCSEHDKLIVSSDSEADPDCIYTWELHLHWMGLKVFVFHFTHTCQYLLHPKGEYLTQHWLVSHWSFLLYPCVISVKLPNSKEWDWMRAHLQFLLKTRKGKVETSQKKSMIIWFIFPLEIPWLQSRSPCIKSNFDVPWCCVYNFWWLGATCGID